MDFQKLIVAYRLASGPSYAHAQNHSQGFKISKNPSWWISDFGILKRTLIYRAPEIYVNEKYSEATDVYVSSIIIYEMLTINIFFFSNLHILGIMTRFIKNININCFL